MKEKGKIKIIFRLQKLNKKLRWHLYRSENGLKKTLNFDEIIKHMNINETKFKIIKLNEFFTKTI